MLQLVRRGEGKRLLARPIFSTRFELPPSCRLGRFSDGDNTRSRRSNSRKKVYTILCACVCIYIPREKESWNGVGISEDWKFNLKRAEFSPSFSFSDRFDRIFDQERERDRSVSILDHRYVERHEVKDGVVTQAM